MRTRKWLAPLVLAGASAPAFAATAPADTSLTLRGEPILIDVLANDAGLAPGLALRNVSSARSGRTAIVDGQVRYIPDAGFVGTDRFHYVAKGTSGPAYVGEVSVRVSETGASVVLAGRVIDDPIAGARVTATVDGIPYSTTADADGYYRLNIASASPGAMVTLNASGTSATGAKADLVSVAGTIERLEQQAGSDGTLQAAENGQVNVTHISTAQYVLLAAANSGEPIDTQAELVDLLQHVDLAELTRLAAVVKLVLDGGYPLPAGVDTVLALISEPASVDAFVAALPAGVLASTMSTVEREAAALAAFAPGRVPESFAMLFPGATGTIRVGIVGHPMVFLDGASSGATSGTARYLNANFRDTSGTWSLVDGRVRVQFAAPVSYEFYPRNACGIQDRAVQSFDAVEITRSLDGDGVDYLQQTSTVTTTTTDLHPTDGCDVSGTTTSESRTQGLGHEDGRGELPFSGIPANGMLLPVITTGRGGAVRVVPAHELSIANGRLYFEGLDDDGSRVVYETRRYQTDGRKGFGVMTIATAANGRQAVKFDLAVEPDGSAALPAAQLARTLRSGFDVSQFQPTEADDFGFFIHNDDSSGPGTGIYESTFYDAAGVLKRSLFSPYAWTWSVVADHGVATGRWTAQSKWLPGSGWSATCTVGVDGCWLNRDRRWNVIAVDGDRLYVGEHLLIFGPGGEVFTDSSRANFYDIQP